MGGPLDDLVGLPAVGARHASLVRARQVAPAPEALQRALARSPLVRLAVLRPGLPPRALHAARGGLVGERDRGGTGSAGLGLRGRRAVGPACGAALATRGDG